MLTASMRDLRNNTREVIDRARNEPVTITDAGVPIAVLSALPTDRGVWDAEGWLDGVLGQGWAPYDSGLTDEILAGDDDQHVDAAERLGLV